jgi:hypothetical protein
MSQLTFIEETVTSKIYILRNQRIMFDFDLAKLYGIETKMLKRAVKRHLDRFPLDFMFELSDEETQNLRYQFGTSSWGGRRYPSFAFTEHGAVMLSSVLNSSTAINASIEVVRTFAKLRQLMSDYQELADKINAMENNYGNQFELVFEAIKQLYSKDFGLRISDFVTI